MPRGLRSVLRIALVVVGVLCIAFVAVIWIAARGMCGNGVLSETFSPDGALRAVVFDRSCGATDSGATEVSILAKLEPLPNTKGNAFIAYNISGSNSSGNNDNSKVRVLWLAPRSLQIEHHTGAHISLAQRTEHGVVISYSTLP
jgi:hypothetical protein